MSNLYRADLVINETEPLYSIYIVTSSRAKAEEKLNQIIIKDLVPNVSVEKIVKLNGTQGSGSATDSLLIDYEVITKDLNMDLKSPVKSK